MSEEDPFKGDEYKRGFAAGMIFGAIVATVSVVFGQLVARFLL